MKRPIRIAITTGDADGIGTEVVSKALLKIKPQKGVLYYLWRSPQCPKRHLHRIDRNFKRITVSSWHEALTVIPSQQKEIIDINSNLSPALWVETAAKASHFGHIDGLVTAPLSKTIIHKSGLKDIGHTDILARVTQTKDLFMAFVGRSFNVVLATGHLPHARVSEELTRERVEKACLAAWKLRTVLKKDWAKRPLALIGLNPHAGENGLIGNEEIKTLQPALENLRAKGLAIEGPLVPDAAFFKSNWSKYSVFVASYHDQGLIPFKAFHGHEGGVHLTLGLPFVRTSVDHGTAKELFGKEKADPGSMIDALKWALELCKQNGNRIVTDDFMTPEEQK